MADEIKHNDDELNDDQTLENTPNDTKSGTDDANIPENEKVSTTANTSKSSDIVVPSAEHETIGQGETISLNSMFRDYWIDYASDVILDRSVPHIDDGLKPVQRRILHAMHETDDGRMTKVANIVGNTMQYHPHGDASIKDALVNMGQKDLLIDTQGNWGNILTGDDAA
ncbi:MAG: DNA gyrase/topoisomerase IV subunit A, partial [Bacteroidales bacterium]|nr:DNA gyrase/topoisomerase IV subunit A [Bacteroidales bacterium]